MKQHHHSIRRSAVGRSAGTLILAAALLGTVGCGRTTVEKQAAAETTDRASQLTSSIYENTHSSQLLPVSDAGSGNSREASSSPERTESSLTESSQPSEQESLLTESSQESSGQNSADVSAQESVKPESRESSEQRSLEASQEESIKPSGQESPEPSEPSEPSAPESSAESRHVHSYGTYTETKKADCTQPGLMTAECACGEKTEKPIPALGHDYQVTKNTASEIVRTCSRCGDTITEKITPKVAVDISRLKVEVDQEHGYDGLEFRPTVRVYDGSKDVTYASHMDYAPSAVKVGAYQLTVTMNGDYTGRQTFLYRIFPSSVTIELGSKTDTSCTVNWHHAGDVDAYYLEYSTSEDFSSGTESVTVDRTKTSYQLTGLKKGTPYYIRLRSSLTVKNEVEEASYFSYWSNKLRMGGSRIEKINGITYVDGILIANKTYSLPASYDPGLDKETGEAFSEMAAAAARDGLSIYIVSGYRSYSTQYSTYNYFVNYYGRARADRSSARPGHSEHQTGLAVDINSTSSAFAYTPEAKWLAENCWKYGFIIRYPQDKEDITGYMYEPWHVRYLGKELAKKVADSGLCLEEYLDITSYYH